MAESTGETTSDADSDPETELRLATLAAENQQLREEYARARQATYRRTALGLLLVGVTGLVGAIVFPDERTVLLALGGTGVFAGVLTAVLTPEQFITTDVGDQLFSTLWHDRQAIIDELGLRGDPMYLPGDPCHLFIPRQPTERVSSVSDDPPVFVTEVDATAEGIALRPTGTALYDELQSVVDKPGTTLSHSIPPVADALVEFFAIADGVDYDIDTTTGRVTVEVSGAQLGDPTRLDHPLPSLIAVTVARVVAVPVRLNVEYETTLVITCTYNPEVAAV